MSTISRHSTFYDLLDALTKPGCAVCTIVSRTRWLFLDSLAYESVNDISLRAKLRDSFGFCNRHAWYFIDTVREAFGAAIIYRDILHTVQRATAGVPARNVLDPRRSCPACVAEAESAGYALVTLGDAIDEPDLRAALDSSDGICGRHLLQAMATVRPGARPKLIDASLNNRNYRTEDPERWRAVGAKGNFSTDDLGLVGLENAEPQTVTVLTDEPFTCPVCTAIGAELAQPASWKSFDDGTNGLCSVHAWASKGDGCSELHRRQIGAIGTRARELAAAGDEAWFRRAIRCLGLHSPRSETPSPPLRCVVCQHQGAVENLLCSIATQPLCFPHLRRALDLRGPEAIAAVQPTWQELDRLLGEYLRREDYRFRSEPRGIEQKSPGWIVALIAGAPGIR